MLRGHILALQDVGNLASNKPPVLPGHQLPVLPLLCHISVPRALHIWFQNASLGNAPTPGAQFTMAGE